MLKVLINYDYTPDWLEDDDYLIYDRSASDKWLKDFDQSKIIKRKNWGHVDFDKLSYIIDNYDTLPEVFILSKANLVPRHMSKIEYDAVKNNTDFTPLLTQTHKAYADATGIVCYYHEGMYYERNDSWYLNAWLPNQTEIPHVTTWEEWRELFMLPNPTYLPFAPGGNYILTRERVRRYSKTYYEQMRDTLDYTAVPSESQLCERSYYLMWK